MKSVLNHICQYIPHSTASGTINLHSQLLVFEAIILKHHDKKLTESTVIKRVLELHQESIDLFLLYAEMLVERGGIKTAIKVVETLFT